MNRDPVNVEKNRAIRAAKDLLYGDDVIEALEKCSSYHEIEHILATERKRRIRGWDSIGDRMYDIRQEERKYGRGKKDIMRDMHPHEGVQGGTEQVEHHI